MLTEQSSRCRR